MPARRSPHACPMRTAPISSGLRLALSGGAATVGSQTAVLVEQILASRPHSEQGYRSGLGFLRWRSGSGPSVSKRPVHARAPSSPGRIAMSSKRGCARPAANDDDEIADTASLHGGRGRPDHSADHSMPNSKPAHFLTRAAAVRKIHKPRSASRPESTQGPSRPSVHRANEESARGRPTAFRSEPLRDEREHVVGETRQRIFRRVKW